MIHQSQTPALKAFVEMYAADPRAAQNIGPVVGERYQICENLAELPSVPPKSIAPPEEPVRPSEPIAPPAPPPPDRGGSPCSPAAGRAGPSGPPPAEARRSPSISRRRPSRSPSVSRMSPGLPSSAIGGDATARRAA